MATITVGTSPVRVDIPPEGATVSNSGATVFHSVRSGLTTTLNEGSIASGASNYFDTPQWFVCATSTTLTTSTVATAGLVSPTAVSVNNYVADLAPQTTTSGTDTTPVSGTVFYGQVVIPANCTLTGISYLIGSVGGTDKAIAALYNNAGVLVANSALAGVTVGTTATFQRLPFTATYAAAGPAMYWVSISMNGTTARLRTHTFGDHSTGSATGVFGTLAAITPPTTFTANTAPYAMTY